MARFQKATKSASKLRLAIFGPSGSGKTMSALRIATGLGGKVAVIDTERGSASKYSDRFNFDVAELADDKSINATIETIKEASGYDTLIIDSLSHSWQELLEEVDRIAKAKYKGNTWSAWSEGRPKQRRLVDAILSYPGHIIATMRSKTEWLTEKDDRTGKSKPVRVGLTPEAGRGIEYEFDLLLEMSVENVGQVIKDRTGKYQGTTLEKPGEDFGQELAAWLAEGRPVSASTAPQRQAKPPAPQQPAQEPQKGIGEERAAKLMDALRKDGVTDALNFARLVFGTDLESLAELTEKEGKQLLADAKAIKEREAREAA